MKPLKLRSLLVKGLFKKDPKREVDGNQKTVGEVFIDSDIELFREWFGIIQDTNLEILEQKDYDLGKKLYEFTGYRVPKCITEKLSGIPESDGPELKSKKDEC